MMRLINCFYFVLNSLRFIQSNGKPRNQFIHPESLSSSQLVPLTLVNNLNGPIVISTDRGEVSAQQSFLSLDVRSVLIILLPETLLCAPNKLFVTSPAGDEVDQAGVGAGGRGHQLVSPAGGVTPEVWPLHQPHAGDAVLLLALPASREAVSCCCL